LLLGAGIAAVCISLLPAGTADKSAGTPQKFNLADLANGESRTFGAGDHAMTATRRGDDVEITYRTGDGKGQKQTLHCTIGKDSCYAMTVGEGGESHVVVLSKSAASDKDAQLKEVTKIVLADDGADQKDLMVFASDDGGNGEPIVVHGDAPGMTWVSEDGAAAASGAGVHVVRIGADGGTMLRCPEGDATLMLKKGEENSGPYFCPRHNLKMEPSKEKVFIKKIEVDKTPKGEEH
jgi:hypothetical protein